MPGRLEAPNPEGNMQTLPRLEPHEAAKQLGFFTAPDGNMRQQILHLKGKAETFADNLNAQGMLNRNQVWTSFTHTISKTLEYPMSATTLTADKWKEVASIINQAALPKAGFVSKFAHDILYGPLKYQGMGKMEFWHNQELTHLCDFVEEVRQLSPSYR